MNLYKKSLEEKYIKTEKKKKEKINIEKNVLFNRNKIESICGDSADVVLRDISFGEHKGLAFVFDGLCNSLIVNTNIIRPITSYKEYPKDINESYKTIKQNIVNEVDFEAIKDINEAIENAMAGFMILFIDGIEEALSFSVQGFEKRGIDEPANETQERGSREAFIESFKVNMTMVRRRLRTPNLQFEIMSVGNESQTRIVVSYLKNRVKKEMLDEVKEKLKAANLDTVFSSGYLSPFLDGDKASFFTSVGVTERPDTFCAKLSEGKIGIIVDGTPFSIYVPHVLIEDFHSFDDYANRPFYAFFIRLLKLSAFVFSILLPGLYVAIASFHPELFPKDVLFSILNAEEKTPFPVMVEAFVIHIIFEIMREAGLRMPKSVGHAVSIVGALVIGDASVTAGLIAAPMLIIVALTAISSFVMPSLYQPIAVIRILFIIVGGTLGIYGIVLCLTVLLINISSMSIYSVPYTSPMSPFVTASMRDTFLRIGWKKLSKNILDNKTLEREET